mgnify:CR=1 FL=1
MPHTPNSLSRCARKSTSFIHVYVEGYSVCFTLSLFLYISLSYSTSIQLYRVIQTLHMNWVSLSPSLFLSPYQPVSLQLTRRFIHYRKSVQHLRKRMFHVRLSRCSTGLRWYSFHPVSYAPDSSSAPSSSPHPQLSTTLQIYCTNNLRMKLDWLFINFFSLQEIVNIFFTSNKTFPCLDVSRFGTIKINVIYLAFNFVELTRRSNISLGVVVFPPCKVFNLKKKKKNNN